ncbi:MAG: LCP family protein [Clostridia bacterium]|nr:LCP family protein [Clostridia bacterium]
MALFPSIRNFFVTFFAALLIFGILAYSFTVLAVRSLSGGFSAETTGEEVPSETDTQFNPFNPGPSGSEVSTIQGNSFNFLLIGLDYQPSVFDDYGEDAQYVLNTALAGAQTPGVEQRLTYEQKRTISADAILVGRVDKEERQMVLTSLSGDTRVMIDGVYSSLGSVLINKGIQFFTQKITALTGFPIDYYAIATISGMEKLIDSLGGLAFRVPCNMEYEDPEEGLTISLKAGSQWLTGKQMLQMMRYVSYEDADISRMEVIREVAATMMTKLSSYTTVAKAPDLFQVLRNYVTTNFTFAAFTDNLDLLFKLDEFTVINYPYPGKMITYNGSLYFDPNTATALSALSVYR